MEYVNIGGITLTPMSITGNVMFDFFFSMGLVFGTVFFVFFLLVLMVSRS